MLFVKARSHMYMWVLPLGTGRRDCPFTSWGSEDVCGGTQCKLIRLYKRPTSRTIAMVDCINNGGCHRTAIEGFALCKKRN
jgi:hypothetical protein